MESRVKPGVVGRGIPRSHARRLAAGRGAYADDLRFPRLLHAAFLRSPHAHARILRLDLSVARAGEGVFAAYDAAALAAVCKPWQTALATWPAHRSPPQPPLAAGTARWQGQPVAVVLATSRALAEDAVERIEVEWQPLAPIAHREAALADADNLAFEHAVASGEAPAGMTTVRRTITFARHTGVPLEPRSIVAAFDPSERKLTVHQATQVPHQMRAVFADHLGLAEQDVRVVTPDIGGGFGVKLHVYDDEMAVCAAALLAARPVKYVCDRLEAFVSDIHARAHTVTVSAAVGADGRLHALELDDVAEAGAYSAFPRSSILEGLQVLLMSGAPYQIDAYKGRLRVAWQSKPATGSYRGVGQPLACGAMETLIDACARTLRMDPADLRRINFRRELSHEACLDQLLALMDYRALRDRQKAERAKGRHLGIGFATFVEQSAPGPGFYGAAGVKISAQEGCTLRLEPSGTVTCITSNPDQGQGVETALAQLVAETLRIPFEDVRVVGGDTAMTAVGGGTFASRGLAIAGEAVLSAARALLERIARVREVMNLPDAPLAEIAALMNYRQHALPPGLEAGPAVTAHVTMRAPFLLANGIQASLLDLDVQTGFVKLLKHWVVEDCGQVINPLLADEQIRGGVVQGIGAALYEECLYDEASQLRNGSMADYLVPMAGEMPDIVIATSRRPWRARRWAPRASARPAPSARRPRSATRSTTRSRPSAPRCCSNPTRPSGSSRPLKIAELRERTVSIAAPMRNASIGFDTMTASAVAMVSERGLTGYAFDSIGRYGKGALLRERFFPRLEGRDDLVDPKGVIDPPACARAAMANEKPGGHGERPGAVALIEAAAWDLRAKAQRVPLWRCIADYYGMQGAAASIAVYASCGHFRTDDVLADEVKRAVDAGYRCVKIKVAGEIEPDQKRLERAAAALPAGTQWAVDANGAAVSEAWFDAISPFKLAWIEEPAPPLDFERLRQVAALGQPIATGENLFSYDDARNLVRYGGLRRERDFLQVDPLLAYGVHEYVRILELWPRAQCLPHAGHLFAAHCVAALGLGMAEAAPDAALVYGGYWDGVRVEAGRVRIPDVPGVGFEAKANLFAVLEAT
jgi:carbon-monoxide dehydrogenase large subunit